MNLTQRYLSSFRGLSREVWTLSIVGFVNRMGMMVMPYLLLYLTLEMHYSVSAAGVVLGIYGVGTLAGIALGGFLSDRLGYRRVQLWSLFLSGLCLIAMGQFPVGTGLAVTIFLFGLTSDAYRPANMAALAHHSRGTERTRAFGLYRLAINLGWSIGPAVGGFLAEIDFEFLFWIDGLTTLTAGVYLLLALPSTQVQRLSEPSDKPQAPPSLGPESPWMDGPFMLAIFLMLMQSLVFFQLSSTLPLYLNEQRGLSTGVIGCLMLINTLIIVLLEMPLIARLDHLPKLRIVGLSCLFVGIGFGSLPFSPGLPLIALGILLWTIGEMLAAPMMSTWVSMRAGEHNRGRYMAAFGMCFSLAQILAPLLGTWTYEHLGPEWPWYGCMGLGLLSYLGFRLLRRVTD